MAQQAQQCSRLAVSTHSGLCTRHTSRQGRHRTPAKHRTTAQGNRNIGRSIHFIHLTVKKARERSGEILVSVSSRTSSGS